MHYIRVPRIKAIWPFLSVPQMLAGRKEKTFGPGSFEMSKNNAIYICATWMFYSETCGFSLVLNPLKLELVVKWKNINTSLEH